MFSNKNGNSGLNSITEQFAASFQFEVKKLRLKVIQGKFPECVDIQVSGKHIW